MAARKTEAEWDKIELEYLAADCSIREIADRYCISDTAIRAKAKKDGWVRAVRKPRGANFREVSAAATPAPAAAPVAPPAPDTAAIGDRGRELIARMVGELDAATSAPGELELLIEVACEGDEDGKRRAVLEKAVSLDSRANVMKTLATALKTLNEASAPQGKKAATAQRAAAIGAGGGRFAPIAPPGGSKAVN